VTDPAQIEPVLRLPLPPSWQRLFERRLTMQQVEDWARRLKGSTWPRASVLKIPHARCCS